MRDVLRRRRDLIRRRAELVTHIQNTVTRDDLPALRRKIAYKAWTFPEAALLLVRESAEVKKQLSKSGVQLRSPNLVLYGSSSTRCRPP